MKEPKKEHKTRYTVVLKDNTRNIIEKAAKKTELNMSEIIEYCVEFTNEKFNWGGENE